MKKYAVSISDTLLGILALAAFAALLIFPAQYAARVSEGVSLWALSVLPVTLPFLFFTLLLARTPLYVRAARTLSPLFSRVFRVSGAGGCVAVLSVLSGYPAGARALLDNTERGFLSRGETFRAACLATTSGPAFLVGTLGTIAGTATGWMLFAAHLIGVWSVSFILGRRADPARGALPPLRADTKNAIAESLSSAVLSVLAVGGAIAVFYALGFMIRDALSPLALPPVLSAALQGMIEMTSGCVLLLGSPSPLSLAVCAFLVTFGGACVLVQEWSFLRKTNIPFLKFLLVKTAQGAVSAAAAFGLAFLL